MAVIRIRRFHRLPQCLRPEKQDGTEMKIVPQTPLLIVNHRTGIAFALPPFVIIGINQPRPAVVRYGNKAFQGKQAQLQRFRISIY
ncbi:hypothetical protein Barb4_04472 [Bacteroidales bacterium Barb4]|nr:hypothetical protein Barb4_04472 [Bacteroidales bacterium Barb4]